MGGGSFGSHDLRQHQLQRAPTSRSSQGLTARDLIQERLNRATFNPPSTVHTMGPQNERLTYPPYTYAKWGRIEQTPAECNKGPNKGHSKALRPLFGEFFEFGGTSCHLLSCHFSSFHCLCAYEPTGPTLPGTPLLLLWTHVYKEYIQNRSSPVSCKEGPPIHPTKVSSGC